MVHGIESHRYYISTSQAGTIEVNNPPTHLQSAMAKTASLTPLFHRLFL